MLRQSGAPISCISCPPSYSTERYRTSWTRVEKQKLESVENIPAFLRRSDIGQFVTCDELISPWCHRAAAVNHVWFVPG